MLTNMLSIIVFIYSNIIIFHIFLCINYTSKNIQNIDELNIKWSKSINILLLFSFISIISNCLLIGSLFLYIQIFISVILFIIALYKDFNKEQIEDSWIIIDVLMLILPTLIKYIIFINIIYYIIIYIYIYIYS